MGYSKRSSKRDVYNNTILLYETRNISNKQTNLTLKAIRERRRKQSKTNLEFNRVNDELLFLLPIILFFKILM